MQLVWKTLLKGLTAIPTVALNLYLIYRVGVTSEGLLRPIILTPPPNRFYVPGMGLALAFTNRGPNWPNPRPTTPTW